MLLRRWGPKTYDLLVSAWIHWGEIRATERHCHWRCDLASLGDLAGADFFVRLHLNQTQIGWTLLRSRAESIWAGKNLYLVALDPSIWTLMLNTLLLMRFSLRPTPTNCSANKNPHDFRRESHISLLLSGPACRIDQAGSGAHSQILFVNQHPCRKFGGRQDMIIIVRESFCRLNWVFGT